MTRIIAGSIGSLQLKAAAKATRPTSDRVKESLFAKLDAMGAIEDSVVLDLFAGTGALGLESASRGAKEVLFVEQDRKAFELLAENISTAENSFAKQKIEIKLHRQNADAKKFLLSTHALFDMVFIDPPYDFTNQQVEEIVSKLENKLAKEALVVIERSSRDDDLGLELEQVSAKNYGDTKVFMFVKN